MGIQALIRILLPREEHWYDMLEEIAGLSHEAAKALLLFKERPASEVQATVQALEHKADDVVRRMGNALARTFVTPIDREDLHRLTGELDDAIDLMNLSARVFALFRLERPTPPMVELIVRLEQATAVLAGVVPNLRKHRFARLIDETRRVRAIEKEADAIYREAISALFQETHTDFREMWKQKEALDHLEAAVDHCDNVGDLLSNLAVKHG